ncbi:MAG: hypothetical protein CVU42_09995 [Chloroflexi bacterium HGW-Chloroflexi-4]|jgi:hypothetical protein|nr:MAG: hypothetical protein CVU42_09995 [Chloroflexi bacterium HGW-Chloroflexi-4]
MPKHLSQKIVTILFLITLGLSACQTATPDPVTAEQTMQAGVAQTLTAAPTSTPIPTATSTATPTASPTPITVAYGPTNFPANVNPLTGLEVEDPAILDRRPVMMKVANQAAGRPHAGLTNADIVFDYYIGNGLDRFVALYYGKDDTRVGSMRSGRLVDIPLTQMYQGIIGIISAWKPELDAILGTLGGRVVNTEHCNEQFKAICDDGPNTETSVFGNTAEMTAYYASKDYATNDKPNLDGMAFATVPPAGGVPANQFTMRFGKNINHQWIYDPLTKKYMHWIDEVDGSGNSRMIPLVDRNNGEQLSTSNVITIFAKLNVLNGDTDSIHEYEIQGAKGRALICRDGKIYDVFYKAGWDTPIQFFDAEGNPFQLQPGNTWIHLTGVYSKVEEEPAGTWMIRLRLP